MRIDKVSKNLRIFRDDLYPFLGGGNKGRKMDAIGKDVISRQANALVTTGGIQSNHCRAVAVFASQHYMVCTLVLHGNKAAFEKQSGNAKIMRMSGAEIKFVDTPNEIGLAMDDAMQTYEKRGMNPYYISGGGHTMEGGKSYIDAVAELKRYCIESNWLPDYIFLASGTGSTQAGILAGLDKFHFSTEVVGISVGRKRKYAEEITHDFYKKLCKEYRINSTNRSVIILDDYLCGGYGQYNKDIEMLSVNSIKDYGFTLDTCYTAKAFYGMKKEVEKQHFKKKILFWHTGGIFNFFAE